MASNPHPHQRGDGLGASPEFDGCRLEGRLWVTKDGTTFLGWGRVVLLERIQEHGSISAAARSMSMGYRHAWGLVDEMNRLSPAILVEKVVGGKKGGGSRLTPAGKTVIRKFWHLVDGYQAWLQQQDVRLWVSDEEA